MITELLQRPEVAAQKKVTDEMSFDFPTGVLTTACFIGEKGDGDLKSFKREVVVPVNGTVRGTVLEAYEFNFSLIIERESNT